MRLLKSPSPWVCKFGAFGDTGGRPVLDALLAQVKRRRKPPVSVRPTDPGCARGPRTAPRSSGPWGARVCPTVRLCLWRARSPCVSVRGPSSHRRGRHSDSRELRQGGNEAPDGDSGAWRGRALRCQEKRPHVDGPASPAHGRALCCPAGMTAIPCACLGIFLGGLLVKKLSLSALGAIRMAMLVNLVSTACYVSFLFLGCDTGPVAGVTVPYGNT